MEDILFSKSFHFYLFRFETSHYRDNSAGVPLHYIGHMLRGHARIEPVNGPSLKVSEGDYFYIPRGLPYRSYWYGDPEVLFESYGFFYLPDTRKFALQRLPDRDGIYEAFGKADITRTDCENIGHFYAALGLALEQMECTNESRHHATVQRAMAYMREHQDFRMADVAQYANVSESGLYAIFKEVKGMTPIQVKWQLQTEKAITLLHTTDLSIEEISTACGFASSMYFRKIFKTITGKTPREVRRENTP